MEYEQRYPHDWKIALTSTEFIVHANLRGQLHALDNLQQEEHLIYHFPDFSMYEFYRHIEYIIYTLVVLCFC